MNAEHVMNKLIKDNTSLHEIIDSSNFREFDKEFKNLSQNELLAKILIENKIQSYNSNKIRFYTGFIYTFLLIFTILSIIGGILYGFKGVLFK